MLMSFNDQALEQPENIGAGNQSALIGPRDDPTAQLYLYHCRTVAGEKWIVAQAET